MQSKLIHNLHQLTITSLINDLTQALFKFEEKTHTNACYALFNQLITTSRFFCIH